MSGVAIYTRLSQDRDGTKTSTQRQEADCRAVAKARRWKVARVYRDKGISAFSGKERPAFDELVAAVGSGAVDRVLAWRIDRIGRRPAELASFLELAKERGVVVVTADGLDSSTVTGKGMMQMAGVFANMESENTAARVHRAKQDAAEKGLPSGGGRRPFGYEDGGMTLRKAEAALVRDGVAAVIEGASIRSVAADWRRRGYQMAPATVRRIVMNPRIAGLRSYHGEVVGRAAWPGIITTEQHADVMAILSDPHRRTTRETARRYLLTGIARCGLCGGNLVSHPSKGSRSYRCRTAREGTGCPGVRIKAETLDDYVTEWIMTALDTKTLTRMRQGSHNGKAAVLARSLRRDEVALERLTTDHYVDGTIGRREFLAAHGVLTRRLEITRRDLAEVTGSRTIAGLPSAGAELRHMWDAADVNWRRSLVEAVVEGVDVGQAAVRGRTDPDRITVTQRSA